MTIADIMVSFCSNIKECKNIKKLDHERLVLYFDTFEIRVYNRLHTFIIEQCDVVDSKRAGVYDIHLTYTPEHEDIFFSDNRFCEEKEMIHFPGKYTTEEEYFQHSLIYDYGCIELSHIHEIKEVINLLKSYYDKDEYETNNSTVTIQPE